MVLISFLLQDLSYYRESPKTGWMWLMQPSLVLSLLNCGYGLRQIGKLTPHPYYLCYAVGNGVQQAGIPRLNQDQVTQTGLNTWAKLDDGSTESPHSWSEAEARRAFARVYRPGPTERLRKLLPRDLSTIYQTAGMGRDEWGP